MIIIINSIYNRFLIAMRAVFDHFLINARTPAKLVYSFQNLKVSYFCTYSVLKIFLRYCNWTPL